MFDTFEQYRKFMDNHFGPDSYLDDIDVIYPGDDAPVATLTREGNKIIIQMEDDSLPRIVDIE